MSEARVERLIGAPRRKPARTSWRGSGFGLWAPAIVVSVALGLLTVPPILIMIHSSLSADGGITGTAELTLANFVLLFAEPNLYISAFNSIVFSAFATVVSLLFGGVLAWVVERTNAPLKALAHITAIVSLGTPYIIYVGAWLFLFGRAGPVNAMYRQLFDTDELLINVYSIKGMVLVEGFLWSPLAFLLLSATFRRANADMEEAARISGASVLQTVSRISMQLARPAILGLALFIFIRNLEAFDVPVLIGTPSRITLLTTEVYLSMTRVPPLLGHASAFSVVLVGVVSVLLYFYGRIARNADKYASVTGKGFRPRPFDLGGWRWAGGAIIVANFVIVLVLPMFAILWNSLTPFARPITLAGFRSFSFVHYVAVLRESIYITYAVNTVVISALAATLALLFASVAAWLSVRRWPGSGLLDHITSVPLVFPGVVLGVAMIEISLRSPVPVYGTVWVIALAFLIRYMPYGMRYAHSGVLQIHRELEEAAGVAGAGQVGILRRIVGPLLSPSIIAGWLFIFLLGAKELSIAVLLAGPNSKTVAVALFNEWMNGSGGEVAAMGVIWTLLMTCLTTILFVITRRQTELLAGKPS